MHPGGVFEGRIAGASLPLSYRSTSTTATAPITVEDPYRFLPTIGELDLHLVGEGRHEELWERLGAHVHDARRRARHRVRGLGAGARKAVSVVGDFNYWDGRMHPMRSLGSCGIWELFLPGVEPGARYKFEIVAPDGEIRLKADPMAFETEMPPKTASVVARAASTSGPTPSGSSAGAQQRRARTGRCRSTRSTWARGG